MRGLFAVVLGAAVLAPSGAAYATAIPAPLATPWPARDGCSSYEGAHVTVDDRVRAVEWRGPDPQPRILDLARDLLAELDVVAEEGCAGACSARVDELRAAARALGAARGLHLTSARAVFDRGDTDDPGYGAWPSFGWIARLAAPSGAAEVACAHHQTLDAMGLPDIHVCRLSVFAGGRHLGDYTPDWTPDIELPDGGAVHLLDSGERASGRSASAPGEQIVVIGSALAQ